MKFFFLEKKEEKKRRKENHINVRQIHFIPLHQHQHQHQVNSSKKPRHKRIVAIFLILLIHITILIAHRWGRSLTRSHEGLAGELGAVAQDLGLGGGEDVLVEDAGHHPEDAGDGAVVAGWGAQFGDVAGFVEVASVGGGFGLVCGYDGGEEEGGEEEEEGGGGF